MMVITWKEIVTGAVDIADQIDNEFKNSNELLIGGMIRGGVIPAMLIAQRLGCKFTQIENPTDSNIENLDILVDDICDTGSLMIKCYDNFPNIKYASLYKRYSTRYNPDYVYEIIKTDDWLRFPWEIRHDLPTT